MAVVWKAQVTHNGSVKFNASYDDDAGFQCEDAKVLNVVYSFGILDTPILMMGSVPPNEDARSFNVNDPEIVASALYAAVHQTYDDDDTLKISFTGDKILSDDVNVDDILKKRNNDDNDIDAFYDPALSINA